MPTSLLRKPFKSVCVDTVLFFAMFALVGHITINYWERFTIQNELFSMKHSLHILKDNIGNIGRAYDKLHAQLKAVDLKVNKKQMDTPECQLKEKVEAKCQAENNKKHCNFQVQTTIPKSMKVILDLPVKKSYVREHKATGPEAINTSTNTRNPPKSTGTTTPSDTTNDRKKTWFNDLNGQCNIHVCHGVNATDKDMLNELSF